MLLLTHCGNNNTGVLCGGILNKRIQDIRNPGTSFMTYFIR